MAEKEVLPQEEEAAGEVRRIPRSRLKVAPCQAACPAGVDVPRYIRFIRKGQFDDALAVNHERIPLPDVCGHACFNPCEKKCAMNQFGEPIAIRMLKRTAVEMSEERRWRKRKKAAAPTGKKVAVVGAGPAGLTAAYYLASLGHGVILFDENPEAGGTMRYGIPRYRLPEEALANNLQKILEGVDFKGGASLGKDLTIEELRKDHDAVLVSVGTTESRKLDLEGTERKGVLWGLEFLQAIARGEKPKIAEKVVVIGGGNVAVDVALSARRLGAERVDMVCLECRGEMPAHEWEIARAEEEGVNIHDSWGPVKILGGKGVEGIELKKCTAVFDGKGNFCPCFEEENRTVIDAGQVIIAVGQAPDPAVSKAVKADVDTPATDHEGVFAAGDFVTGPTSIIQAIAAGRAAASAIDRFLGGAGEIGEELAQPEDEVEIPETRSIKRRRQPVAILPPKERVKSFTAMELGYGPEQAFLEASRCLVCDARMFEVTVHTANCKACGYCNEVCKMGVFAQSEEFNKRGVKPLYAASPEKCVGCLMCFYACPDFAIEVREVTDGGEE
jgi:NADPH-dependent glutamate synthase beta subunit-like oxidoreductase